MTAPNYTDKDVVRGVRLKHIKRVADRELFGPGEADKENIHHDALVHMARTAVLLWRARDQARETADLQDAAIHKGLPRLHALEKVLKAAWKLEQVVPRGDFMEMSKALFEIRELEAKS